MECTGTAQPAEPIFVGHRVELQLLTTLKCNLKCTYCSLGTGDVLRSQKHATYSAAQLRAFVDRHLADREVYITLYGGEPALNTGFALELMRLFPECRFNIQTNGTLLDRLPDALLARLSNFMVSVDGGERTTDGFRGKGVYRKVMENVRAVRDRTAATLTARVTWWSGDTTFEELDELTGTFDHVYFQFAQDEGAQTPDAVAKKKQVLERLVEKFFASATLYPVVPIMGTVRNKVVPSRVEELCGGLTQCRVSTNLLNVMPDGKIFPCPDMLYLSELQQGDVVANWVRKSPLQPHPAMPCRGCAAYHYCRGNCMKNLYLAYVKGESSPRHDPKGWFARAPMPVRKRLMDAEVYEFCEVMP